MLTSLCEVVSACGEAVGEFGYAISIGGSASGDALKLNSGLVGLRACLANLLIERIARGDAFSVFGVHGLHRGRLGIDLGS